MKNTLILIPTHRGLSQDTQECVDRLGCPSKIILRNCANVCKARSIAFERALEGTAGTPIDTVLCIDDDMVFEPKDAFDLVRMSRLEKSIVSACAVTAEGRLAARQMANGRWLTGLAFTAVPLELLRSAVQYRRDEPPALLRSEVGGIRPWCLTGPHPDLPGEWVGEDWWFCLHFGGVLLAPLGVGHVKPVALYPEQSVVLAQRKVLS